MTVYDAILTRRSIKDFKPDAVPAELLEKVLAAGLWAQNHRMTQPWRFTILGPETHRKLVEQYAQMQADSLAAHSTPEQRQLAYDKGLKKLAAKPYMVAVSSIIAPDADVRREDYGAISCAIQNIQLAAWGEGLGMQWSTGKFTTQPSTYELLKIDPVLQEIVGILFFGFPAQVPAANPRKSLHEVSQWLD